ncbi:hypothetical protein QR680_000287 [Steinernema hermaphroditum]|uniref:Uncharacterized protein n=1 Tax=Steinernema hermaphroditum TaxID=289476 RepID=A0AA39GU31_9BILA|nr:hypothetical protein QR680_000287 [Steinernema hermaphroditum]
MAKTFAELRPLMPLLVAHFFLGSLDGILFSSPILFLALLSVAVFISSDIYVLVNYLSFAETSVVLMVAGHLKLRATRPFLKRFTCKNR